MRRRAWRLTFCTARDGVRWRLQASNGRIVAASSEAFASQRGAEHNAKLALRGLRATIGQLA